MDGKDGAIACSYYMICVGGYKVKMLTSASRDILLSISFLKSCFLFSSKEDRLASSSSLLFLSSIEHFLSFFARRSSLLPPALISSSGTSSKLRQRRISCQGTMPAMINIPFFSFQILMLNDYTYHVHYNNEKM